MNRSRAELETAAIRPPFSLARLVDQDTLSVRFQLPDAVSPLDLGTGEDDRVLAVAFLEVRFDPVE